MQGFISMQSIRLHKICYCYRWNMKIIPEEDELLFLFHDNNCVVIVQCDYLMFIG